MAKNESSKSKAEIYREERKERLAKAAKKNAKSVKSRNQAISVIKKVLAVVIVLAIVGGIGWKIVDSFGIIEKNTTVLTVTASNGKSMDISATQYKYFYKMSYQNIQYYEEYYSQMGYAYTGYDFSVDPAESTSKNFLNEDGTPIYLKDYVADYAKGSIEQIVTYYLEAQELGMTLTDKEKADIETQLSEIKTQAEENNYSMNAYLRAAYSAGLTEKGLRELLEIQAFATKFYSEKETEYQESITDEQVKKHFADNKDDYTSTDVTYYQFKYEKLEKEGNSETDEALKKRQDAANAEVDKIAQGVIDSIEGEMSADALNSAIAAYEKAKADSTAKDEDKKDTDKDKDKDKTEKLYVNNKAGTTYSEMKTAISEEASKWIYDDARKVGDITLIKNDTGANIILVTKTAYEPTSRDVRHILVKFDAKDSKNVTDAEKQAAFKEAQAILDEYNKGEKTQNAFSALAKEKSEDTGSAESGGLIAGIKADGSYVESFEKWSMADERKAGDTEIIESEFGYHIMYYVKDNGPVWKEDIRTELQQEALTEYFASLTGEETSKYKIAANDKKYAKATDQICEDIALLVKQNAATSSR